DVPNACTHCHADRDDQWAADFIKRRTGRSEPWYPHMASVAGARRHDPAALPGLLSYAASEANPAILRATALQESWRFPTDQQLQAATRALSASEPLVRAAAVQSLEYLAPQQRLALLRPVLVDPVKAVRMAAARQLVNVRPAQLVGAERAALERLFEEYRRALLHNADLPEAMSDLGVFQAAQGDLSGAEQSLLHARKLAP